MLKNISTNLFKKNFCSKVVEAIKFEAKKIHDFDKGKETGHPIKIATLPNCDTQFEFAKIKLQNCSRYNSDQMKLLSRWDRIKGLKLRHSSKLNFTYQSKLRHHSGSCTAAIYGCSTWGRKRVSRVLLLIYCGSYIFVKLGGGVDDVLVWGYDRRFLCRCRII